MTIQTTTLFHEEPDKYGSEYDKHLFEQYKLYVEMTDRVSARRMLANTFFLTTHTALITAFTVMLKENLLPKSFLVFIPIAAVTILCFVWWRVVLSYKQLNSGKFKVIHAIEKRLPMSPYAAEWEALGSGKNRKLYLPITHVENFVPLCFGVLYIFLGLSVFVCNS